MIKIVAAAALLAVASAAAPGYAPAPAYKAAPVYADEPAVYAYNYAVADDYSGTAFSAGENRDGYATSGSYSVNLPDGRIQTVTYTVADAAAGYIADVAYTGEAAYPPAPAPYKAAP